MLYEAFLRGLFVGNAMGFRGFLTD
jgi:hypothetical protein